MNKDVEQHLKELIDFYSKTEINDIDYLKKLFVRNLKDVQRRYIKYDKPRKEILGKAIEWVHEHISKYNCKGITIIDWDSLSNPNDLLELLGDKE